MVRGWEGTCCLPAGASSLRMRRLARRTPVRQTCVEPGLLRVNQRPAEAAPSAASSIYPELLARIETACRPATDRWTESLRAAHHVGREQLARDRDQPIQLGVAERRHRRKRIDPGDEENLRLENVADAGDDALIQQGVADRVGAPS